MIIVVLKVNQLLDLMKQHLTLKNVLIGWCWEFILLMKLENIVSTDKKSTRDGFGAGLHAAGQQNSDIVALCADLVGSLKMQSFF